MKPKRKAILEAEQKLREIFEQHIPFNRVLGLRMESMDAKAPRLRFDMRPELVGNPTRGILHGGVISSVLDVVGGAALCIALIEKSDARKVEFPNIGTIDLRVDYLRPGRGRHFIATGRVVRMGSRIAVVHMELENDAAGLIATGSAAYVVG